ncbi:hypothetical protein [Stutzerimonas nitrititolerans]|uniref:hypothetical protein n=1 Tax=Stutzerimonas nitrititolerans TaxID=2482751 RepID=UPI00128EE674|nr:hypothetical protein [Stutzerimonas nitrititolerans]
MIAIIGWLIGLVGCVGYGAYRIFKLYSEPVIEARTYMENGIMLIVYSALVVGAASFLSAAITKFQLTLTEPSLFWIGVNTIGELLQYLAPFVFAAIGVNMISHALTAKNA